MKYVKLVNNKLNWKSDVNAIATKLNQASVIHNKRFCQCNILKSI